MTQAIVEGVEVSLETVGSELRVEDVELAGWLEYADAKDIRKLIERNSEFLLRQGVLPRRGTKPKTGSLGGRPTKSYWLNKKQALFVASKSDKPKGSEILLMLVEVFDRAQERARQEAIEQAAAKSYIFQKVFLELPEHTTSLWTPPRLGPIAALYGVTYTGGRAPMETRRIQREIYDLIIGSDLIARLREENPEPPGESGNPYIYDHFHPTVRAAVERELEHVATLADGATNRDHFRAMLRRKYGTSMLQLVFGGKDSGKWSLPPAFKDDDPEES